MNDDDPKPRKQWTPDELRKCNMHPWVHRNYQPEALRDILKVLADAEPDYDRGLYYWHAGGDEWWNVVPPAGILPMELIRAMPVRVFNRRKDAVRALTEAAALIDARVPKGQPYTLLKTDADGTVSGTAHRVFWWCHHGSCVGAVWLGRYDVYTGEEKHETLLRIRRTSDGTERPFDEALAEGDDREAIKAWLEDVAEVVIRDGSE